MTVRPGTTPAKPVCLLTGAAGTLGTAFCRAYAGHYTIAGVYHRRPLSTPSQDGRFVDPLDPAARLAENEHPVFGLRANLENEADQARVVGATLEQFGSIDLLVNAAVHSTWGSLLHDERVLASAERQFRLNAIVPLKLAVLVARSFWSKRPEENAAKRRSIVNISSTAGLLFYPNQGQAIYSASKAALNDATRHLANEFQALGIRANVVAPNAFPSIVPVERVAWAIHQFAQGETTGMVYLMDSSGDRFV